MKLAAKLKAFPFIRQRDMTECGTTCLAMILKFYGLYNIQAVLREMGNVTAQGTDLFTLSELGQYFGFACDGYQLEFANLPEVKLPCIAHYEGNHFVVIYKVSKDSVWISDPAMAKLKLCKTEFCSKWNGIILTMEPTREVFKNKDVYDIIAAFKQKKKDVIKNFYLSIIFPFKYIIFEIFLASFILQILGLSLPFFTQGIVDKVLVYQDKKLLYAILLGMGLIFIVQVVLTYLRNILLTQFKVQFELDFFTKFFYHFIHLQQTYFDSHKREDFINRFQENLKIRKMFSSSILESFINLLFVFNFILILFFYNLELSIVSLIFITLFFIILLIYTPRLVRLEERIFNENVKTMGTFLDTLLGMQTVKLLVGEKIKFWEWKNKYKIALNKVLEIEKSNMFLQSFLRSLNLFGQIIVYFWGAFLSFRGQLTIGEYIGFIGIYQIIINSINNISSIWFMVLEASITFAKVNDVFIQEPEETDLITQRTEILNPVITFKDLSFRYSQNSDEYVLNGLSLTIKFGEHIGIVGRNGSGKTTLVKLLTRMYKNYDGKILINDVELRNVHPHYLRKKIVMIPQDIYIFSGTIKENILLGKYNASMEEVIEAAKLADIHDFIKTLFLGYNYKIGESGAGLSGGQKLKIAFARLFLSNPEVIILDEASSFLDVETERKILKNVKEHFKNKTIISIAHRLSTLRDADRIIALDKGELVEQGTHEELIESKGLYYEFMKLYVDF